MTLHNLLLAHRLTFQAVSRVPLSGLALAVAWLDPVLALSKQHDLDIDGWDETQEFIQMLEITRTCFPTIYAQAVQRLRRHEPVMDFVYEEISKEGILVNEFEYPFSWGIPLPCYSATWEEPEWLEYHPEAEPALALFGVRIDEENGRIDCPDTASMVASALLDNLENEEPPGWECIANLIRWLWGLSGNSLVDWDEETLYSVQPLSWTPDDVAFARLLIEEAEKIYESAQSGIRLLKLSETARTALETNIRQIQPQLPQEVHLHDLAHLHIARGVDERRGRACRLEWPDVADSAERAAAPDPDVL